jgi:hypothetical protein
MGNPKSDSPVRRVPLEETYKAEEAGCQMLAATGLRTALDSCFEAIGLPSGDPFAKKLQTLKAEGYIGDTEHELLAVLIDAGSAAAHRGWVPQRQHIHELMDVLENFVQRVFVNGKRALEMKADIPQKQPRSRSS